MSYSSKVPYWISLLHTTTRRSCAAALDPHPSFGSNYKYHLATPMNVWLTHGILALVAWGLLSPLATLSSIFRPQIFPDPRWDRSDRNSLVGRTWVKVHRYLYETVILLTWILFFIAVGGVRPGHHFNSAHKIVGFVIFLATPVLWGLGRVLMPPKLKKTKKTKTATTTREHDDHGEPGEITTLISSTMSSARNDDALEAMESQAPPREASTTLILVWSHRSLGLVVSVLALWEIYSGLGMVTRSNSIHVRAYLGWCGLLVFVITILTLRRL